MASPADCHFLLKDDELAADVLQGLGKLRQGHQFTDVTLKAGDFLMPCHRVVLAAASPYFNAMFTSGFQESTSPTVEIKSTDPETLQTVVNYVYSAEIKLTTENVQNLVQASSEYQFDRLKEACEKFMIQQLSSVNCFGFCTFAKLFTLKSLQEEAMVMTLRNFASICPAELAVLSEAELVEYISDSNLVVPNEDTVFEAVSNWVNSDLATRRLAFKRLLTHVRLPYCSSAFLGEVVENEPLMSARLCKKKLREAQKFQSQPDNQRDITNQRNVPRKCFGVKHRLVVIGGLLNLYRELPNVIDISLENVTKENKKCWSFDEDSESWCLLTELPLPLMSRSERSYSVCVFQGDLLLTGGVSESSVKTDCWLFDVENKKWKTMPSMIEPRYRHASIALGHQAYVIGGEDDDFSPVSSVECFDKRSQTWRQVKPMNTRVYEAVVATIGHNVYVFGGRDAQDNESLATQEYSTTWKEWKIKADMPLALSDGSAVSMDELIFLVGGYCGDCICYNPAQDTWSELTQSVNRHIYGSAVAWKGKIVVGGGSVNEEDEDEGSSVIEEYDPATDSWSTWNVALKTELRQHHMLCMDLPLTL